MKIIQSKKEIPENINKKILLIDSDEKTARAIIASLKQKKFKNKIGVFAQDNKFNRRAIETLNIDYLLFSEFKNKKNTLKQRDSGLNHVIAKEAAQKNIAIVIEISRLRKQNQREQAETISKIIQNIKICRKAKCKIKIYDLDKKSNNYDLKAFATSLGMSSQQTKNAVIQFY